MKIDLDELLGTKEQKLSSFRKDRLVVLRMGLGRDSITMLVLLAQGKLRAEGRLIGPKDIDAVVFTDVGHEWPFTYALIPRVRAFCEHYGMRFIVQERPPKEGPNGWLAWMKVQVKKREEAKAEGKSRARFGEPPWRQNPPAGVDARARSGYYNRRIPLFYDFASKDAIIRHDDPSCTIIHKIEPNREMLVDMATERGLPTLPVRPHLMLIGYAADEEQRIKEAARIEKLSAKGGVQFDTEAYPLVEMGITKAMEQEILDREYGMAPGSVAAVSWMSRSAASGGLVRGGFSDVKKSGCRMCKEQDRAQFYMLLKVDPEMFHEVEETEKRAVARTGPWMAVFSYHRKKKVRGVPNPALEVFRKEGWLMGINPNTEEKLRTKIDAAKQRGDRASVEALTVTLDKEIENPSVWVYIPLRVQVMRWLEKYKAEHGGQEPDLEEIARKEYRGCAIEKIPG